MSFLIHIKHASKRRGTGNKARSLHTLYKKKFRLPGTYVIPVEARKIFTGKPNYFREELGRELKETLDLSKAYAVRSSGETEDGKEHSYAGQFDTFLDVKGLEDILDAVENVWSSADRIIESQYAARSEAKSDEFGMAVIIQEMVSSVWSGVAFSINPVTGRNECVIEAVCGSGIKLVQDGMNPERWIWHQGSWEEEDAVPAELKSSLEELIRNIPRLRKIFGGEVDIEWSYDGSAFYYLQCRPVTSGKYPNIYSNHISREVLPGMIKPLVWSINIPLVNSAWIRLLEGMLGKLHILPEQLSESFYYRAYFNMGTLGSIFQLMGMPRDSLESLMGRKDPSGKSSFKPSLKTMTYLPSILGFMFRNLFLRRKFEKRFQFIQHETEALSKELEGISAEAYPVYFQKLQKIASEAAYYNIIIPLSMQISNRMLQGKLKKRKIPFEKINFARDFPLLNEYDPGEKLSKIQEDWSLLPPGIRDTLENYEDLLQQKEKKELRMLYEDIQDLLLHFGHFSESGNDFSYTPWKEDPEFLFQQIKKGIYEGDQPGKATDFYTIESKGIPGRAYRRAGRYRLFREMISSEYTRSYGLFRTLFLKTGAYLQQSGYLEDTKDVFYLSLEEHDHLLQHAMESLDPGEPSQSNGTEVKDVKKQITKIKKEMEQYRDISLPSVIYGDIPPPLPTEHQNVLTGIATSPGIFEGEIVVVKGYEDFKKKVDGKILVIPFSDVGWTPLLVRAGAIVSESGGILSHASIVARELSIPAISSVDHACKLKDGVHARIDGFAAKLILDKEGNGSAD